MPGSMENGPRAEELLVFLFFSILVYILASLGTKKSLRTARDRDEEENYMMINETFTYSQATHVSFSSR